MNSFPDFSSQKPLPQGERLERDFSFPSKLLLFGEYGLMYDAMALSVPFPQFSGYLDFGTDQRHRESTDEIVKLYEHLKKGESFQKLHFAIDLDRLNRDLQNGLYFNSNIPQQYGVGSSGALVAALFNRYAVVSSPVNGLEPTLLKNDFALLESYFHGRSSGVDPLISFLNHPLLIDSKKDVRTVNFDLQQSGLSVALIDTKTNSATEPLVQHFIDRFNDPIFEKAFESQFIPANNGCIESLLDGNKQVFFTFLEQLIRFELFHFQRMIPGDFHSVIQNALNDKIFVKLLGSGGGGFLLVFAETELHLRNWEEKSEISLQMITKSDQAISNHLIT